MHKPAAMLNDFIQSRSHFVQHIISSAKTLDTIITLEMYALGCNLVQRITKPALPNQLRTVLFSAYSDQILGAPQFHNRPDGKPYKMYYELWANREGQSYRIVPVSYHPSGAFTVQGDSALKSPTLETALSTLLDWERQNLKGRATIARSSKWTAQHHSKWAKSATLEK